MGFRFQPEIDLKATASVLTGKTDRKAIANAAILHGLP
jgi:hypothetical protein